MYFIKTYLKSQDHLKVKIKVQNIKIKWKEIIFLSDVNVVVTQMVLQQYLFFCSQFTSKSFFANVHSSLHQISLSCGLHFIYEVHMK